MHRDEYEAAVAAFIRSNGVTRCPTACALPTQGTISAIDRAALQNYVASRSKSRRQAIAKQEQFLWAVSMPAVSGE
jgi:hypothetical protein